MFHKLFASATAIGICCSITPLAHAAEPEPNWQISRYGVDKLHEQGLDGTGQVIAIYEGGIDLNSPDLQGADIEYVPLPPQCKKFRDPADPRAREFTDHGTWVASMIVGQGGPGKVQGVAPRAKLIMVESRVGFGAAGDNPNYESEECRSGARDAVQRALPFSPTVYSSSVTGNIDSRGAYFALTDQSAFSSAGNFGDDLFDSQDDQLSATPGLVQVGAAGPDRSVSDFSGRVHDLAFTAPGENLWLRDSKTDKLVTRGGTSLATPYAAGIMALAKQKWPEATDLQLQQSMARTAFGANGELRRDPAAGAGHLDPYTFVTTDPSSQPHEPPFLPDDDSTELVKHGDKYIPFYNALDGIDNCDDLPGCVNGKLKLDEAKWQPPGAAEHVAYAEKISSPNSYTALNPLKWLGIAAAAMALPLLLAALIAILRKKPGSAT